MSFDLDKILQAKRALRQQLAARPVVQKLALLDTLRERTLAIRRARPSPAPDSAMVEEASAPYHAGPPSKAKTRRATVPRPSRG
jgi:hypothetical protein